MLPHRLWSANGDIVDDTPRKDMRYAFSYTRSERSYWCSIVLPHSSLRRPCGWSPASAFCLWWALCSLGFVLPWGKSHPPVDYDADDNDLIEVATLAQLNAIRWDLNGDGTPGRWRQRCRLYHCLPQLRHGHGAALVVAVPGTS